MWTTEQRKAYNDAHREERTAYARRWREANRERYNANARERRLRSLDADRQRKREYERTHPEAMRAKRARWQQRYPHKAAAKVALRRASERRATPPWADVSAIVAVYEAAARLTRDTGVRHHVDHMYPLRGRTICGLHVPYNLQVLTEAENLKKSNKLTASVSV